MSATDAGDPLLERLDHLIRVVELALSPQIATARSAIREDPLDAAILDAAAGNWRPAAGLLKEVEAKTGKKKSSLHDHISSLVERGFLEKVGSASATKYRTNPVVG